MSEPGSGGRPAAFFDLDKTLMAGSSGFQFARAARRNGMVTSRQLAGWAVDHLVFRLRGSTDSDTEELVAQAEQLLRGVPERRLKRMVPDLLELILPRIYPQMIEEVRRHQDEGRPTFIVSAAGHGIVSLLALVLDMQGGIGTRYEVDEEGAYTGKLELNYGEQKIEPIRRFAEEHEIDLEQSWAYSDSISDLPMLELVGNPVAVNPDSELAELAASRGWQVMRFEKLGRRLKTGGGLAGGLLAGWGITWGVMRYRDRSMRRQLRRRWR